MYQEVNEQYEVALLTGGTNEDDIARGLNTLLENADLYKKLQANTKIARKYYCWQREEKQLVLFYRRILLK